MTDIAVDGTQVLRCRRCRRKLTSATSRARGFGQVCYQREQTRQRQAQAERDELAALRADTRRIVDVVATRIDTVCIRCLRVWNSHLHELPGVDR